jgi:hypothetical protein
MEASYPKPSMDVELAALLSAETAIGQVRDAVAGYDSGTLSLFDTLGAIVDAAPLAGHGFYGGRDLLGTPKTIERIAGEDSPL